MRPETKRRRLDEIRNLLVFKKGEEHLTEYWLEFINNNIPRRYMLRNKTQLVSHLRCIKGVKRTVKSIRTGKGHLTKVFFTYEGGAE